MVVCERVNVRLVWFITTVKRTELDNLVGVNTEESQVSSSF